MNEALVHIVVLLVEGDDEEDDEVHDIQIILKIQVELFLS